MITKKTINILLFGLVILCLPAHATFILLMGPSGVGKSTIISHLQQRDSRFIYISPFTTRELREGEKDKIQVSIEEIEQLNAEGKLLTVNYFYNTYYATPKYVIDEVFAQNNFPILDWPIEKLNIMEQHYPNRLYRVYIEPEDTTELLNRLQKDNRNIDGKRYNAGVEELEKLNSGTYDSLIDLRIINRNNCAEEIAQEIYQQFIDFTNKQ